MQGVPQANENIPALLCLNPLKENTRLNISSFFLKKIILIVLFRLKTLFFFFRVSGESNSIFFLIWQNFNRRVAGFCCSLYLQGRAVWVSSSVCFAPTRKSLHLCSTSGLNKVCGSFIIASILRDGWRASIYKGGLSVKPQILQNCWSLRSLGFLETPRLGLGKQRKKGLGEGS